ncbi:putative cyclin-A3-1 [Drosophila subobscura]|uniref:putative cyclin-A3-1 n=1 Tax=Drosophila subobscura TaxID=7241 RepID=UPI00155A60AE|nr:putative cyclin-A3-1 [Drosophila subobscura]
MCGDFNLSIQKVFPVMFGEKLRKNSKEQSTKMSGKLKISLAEKYRRYCRGPFKHPKMPFKKIRATTKQTLALKSYLNDLEDSGKAIVIVCLKTGGIRQKSSIRGLRFRDESATPERSFKVESPSRDELEPPSRDELEPPSRDELEPPSGDELEPPSGDELEPPSGDELERPSGNTSELENRNMTDPQQDPRPSNTLLHAVCGYDDEISHCTRCRKDSRKRRYRGLSVCECWSTSLIKDIDPFYFYAKDIFNHLFLVESTLPVLKSRMAGHKELTPNMRRVLVNWLHAVHNKLSLRDEVFEMAIGIIDRYLQQVVKEILPSDLNLMGLTALILASKYEHPRPTFISWFLMHTDGGFTAEMICDMELQILQTINGDLSRPLPSQFLHCFCMATEDFAVECQHLAHYYVELALMDTELASVKPSEMAAAALFLALNLSDGTPDGGLDESLWTRPLADCSRCTALRLRPTVLRMAQLPLKAEQAELLSIRQKFSSRKYNSVSLAPELKERPRLDSILNTQDQNEPPLMAPVVPKKRSFFKLPSCNVM